MAPPKRCICGRAASYPLCDGSHDADDWSCKDAAQAVAALCFIAGPHHFNLAEKLASDTGGLAAHRCDSVIAERAIILTEGLDLEALAVLINRVQARRRTVVAIGRDPATLGPAFAGDELVTVADGDDDGDALSLWARIRAAIDRPAREGAAPARPDLFISHAVKDEAIIQGPIEQLRRHYSAEVFLCADSIAGGADWNASILAELERRRRFILLVSAASVRSSFCAFEVGYALALRKPLGLISLDGARPPAFVQHRHMHDLSRLRAARPWLDPSEALLEALLRCLEDDEAGP